MCYRLGPLITALGLFTFSARMEGHLFTMLPCMDAAQGLKRFFKMVMVIQMFLQTDDLF